MRGDPDRTDDAPGPGLLPRTLLGAAVGGGVSLLLVGIGVARAAIAPFSGGQVAALAVSDVRMLEFYVAGFVVAGALVGAVGLGRGGRARGYAGFMVGGAVVVLIADKGSIAALGMVDAAVILLLGPAMGGAMAYGWYRGSS